MSEFGPTNQPTDTLTLRQPVESERVLLERGQSTVFSPEKPIDIDIETGSSIVGALGLPGNESDTGPNNVQSGDLRIVHNTDVGYLICAPQAKIVNGLPESSDWAKFMNETPLNIGARPGDKVVIGREGVYFTRATEQGVEDSHFELDSAVGDMVRSVINPYVSNRHLQFEVAEDGNLEVTDLSKNGTSVTRPKE